jgi:7-cyano-7-deazaguanine synthase
VAGCDTFAELIIFIWGILMRYGIMALRIFLWEDFRMANTRRAVVILSGGLDSSTCMGLAQAEGRSIYPITFDYGQRHVIELEAARAVSEHYGVLDRLKVVQLAFLSDIGGSALTDHSIDVPQDALQTDSIPITYVPGRNLLFLAMAGAYAETIGAQELWIGVNALDYSGYPDCRPAFIEQMEQVLATALKAGVDGQPIQICAPLIHWSKSEIIRNGSIIGVPYELTTSCYVGGELPCGSCDSCLLRLKGFEEAGLVDPLQYQS